MAFLNVFQFSEFNKKTQLGIKCLKTQKNSPQKKISKKFELNR
jgi:hypothetical protein